MALASTLHCTLPWSTQAYASTGLQWNEAFCGGAWMLTGHADVSNALRDPRFSVRRGARWINTGINNGAGRPATGADLDLTARKQLRLKAVFARSLLFMDGRSHRRLRDIVTPGFKPGDLQQIAPAIATMANRLIAGMQADASDGQRVDFVERFARPLPTLVIGRLMGLPSEPPDAFISWSADIAAFIGSPTPDGEQTSRALQALGDMCAFFALVLDDVAGGPPDGWLARIAHARLLQRITHTEALAQCCTLLFAGYETTRNLLANGLLALLRHPDQWAALKAEPFRLRNAIREMLRYDSPVQYTGRRLVADVDIRGQRLRRGDLAILHIGQANHDPLRFSNPQRFDIGRDEGSHLSFGHGPHACIGAALTQLEAEIAFGALMRTMPDMRLDTGAEIWQPTSAYRALEYLPLFCKSQHHA